PDDVGGHPSLAERRMGRPVGAPSNWATSVVRSRTANGARLRAVLVEVRVEATPEQCREVPVRPEVSDVERILDVPLGGHGVNDVVGVQRAALLELHAVAQLACPRREIGIRVAARRERGLWVEAGDLVVVERIEDLAADPERVAVTLVTTVQA